MSFDVVLLCVTVPVAGIAPLIVTLPLPAPELVTVPVGTAPATMLPVLLALNTTLPVPVTPPVSVYSPLPVEVIVGNCVTGRAAVMVSGLAPVWLIAVTVAGMDARVT